MLRSSSTRRSATPSSLIVGIAYYTLLEGGADGSDPRQDGARHPGHRPRSTAGRSATGRAFIRYIGRIVSAIPLLLGYFWMLWDNEKQTWHDKFAGAVVVPTSSYPVG